MFTSKCSYSSPGGSSPRPVSRFLCCMNRRIPKWIRNKYTVAVLGFFLWIMLFNDIDLVYIIQRRADLSEMRSDIKELQGLNEKVHSELHDLTTNMATLEKFAREKYYMKRSNEDVFVFRERAD